MAPTVYGSAAASLNGPTPTWTTEDRARIGALGEQRTAHILGRLLPPDVAVFHDLKIPIPKITANVDHAIVSGRHVWLIDSKAWAAGFYWTVGGMTFRGFKRFKPADKQTMRMARNRYKTMNGRARLERPIVVIHSTSKTQRPIRLGMLRIPGARAMTAEAFERFVKRIASDAQLADPEIVADYRQLLNHAKPIRSKVGAR